MFASFLGAAALYAGVASAAPMVARDMMSGSSSAAADKMAGDSMASASSSADYSYQTSSADAMYGGASSSATYAAAYTSAAAPAYTSAAAPAYTSAAAPAYSSPSYGSGSSSWGGSGYDSCVSQCMASYGAPSAMAMPTETASAEGSYGTGKVHTVWVAPKQGVLRYVPFATNASVGDTIKFIWGGNNHTVTKSSILGICNKTSDAPFVSGTHDANFTFTQVVNDTNATFFYCGTPGHCQKGMFGIINAPNAFGSASSAAQMIPQMAANNSDMAAAWAYTKSYTANNTGAATWGNNMDMSGVPSWAQSSMAENIMYTRAFLAANPEVLNSDGTIDMSNAGSNALMLPEDISTVAKGSNNAASSSTPAAATSASASSTPSTTASPVGAASGAGMVTSPRVAVALVAVVAAFFAL
ncbi:hypothetical protein EVG20_g3991 [Dentipellis fragilis]|uniref:Phytocyanin domain-containing protein n=1 Tax=Dentipellis fragilis TaxID=205917 RepID=A0A4Y9YY45_9AGAM|nr:hypothetical protein EVG20_g3991 [Dentipellis fragilis]